MNLDCTANIATGFETPNISDKISDGEIAGAENDTYSKSRDQKGHSSEIVASDQLKNIQKGSDPQLPKHPR